MKRNLRFALYTLLLACVLSLSACAQTPDCTRKDVLCIGLVTDTLGLDDHGINQDAWNGLQNAKASGNADEIAYIESVDMRDYEKNITYFTEHGYDVIITTGIGLRDETRKAADLHKNTVFVGINQPADKDTPHPNLIPVTFAEDQMGFVAGVSAARITKTGIVGAACEKSDIDSMWRTCEGFRAGVKFANAEIKPVILYNDNVSSDKLFLDEEWGRKTAQDMIQRGVDIIFAAGGVTGQGAIRAAVEAQVKAIGAERDQAAALDESNSWAVTSVYGDAKSAVEEIAQHARDGNLSGLSPTRVKFIPFGPKLPESLTKEINELVNKLWNGEIKTNVTITKP